MDRVPQNLITEQEATFILKSEDIVQQVKNLLEMSEGNPTALEEKCKTGFRLACQNLTWKTWEEKVHREIMNKSHLEQTTVPDMFAHESYRWEKFRNNTTIITKEECWNHWCHIGQYCGFRCTIFDRSPPLGQAHQQFDTPYPQPLNLKEMQFVIQANKVRHSVFKIPKLADMKLHSPLRLYWKNAII